MESFLTICLFFIYLWGFGFTTTFFLKKEQNFLERQIVNLGTGLGVFALLSIFLNFLSIPLDWKIFLALSMIFPAIILFKNRKNFKVPKFKLKKSDLIVLLVLLISLTSLYVYAKGAFAYPYLEDEDPWGHSVGVKYVAIEKNAYDPPLENVEGVDPVLSYIDPYPPAYDILMGILHQTSLDLTWTLKFFNALIISLGFLFFYVFAKRFIGSRKKALLATFLLAVIPSYLSHFIWAHALVVTLFFPTMYAFEMMDEDKKWAFVAAILVGAIWVSQNISQPIKLTIMIGLYLLLKSITTKKFSKLGFTAVISGIILSLSWWGVIIKKHTLAGFFRYYAGNTVQKGESFGVLSGSGGGFNILDFLTSLIRAVTGQGAGSRSRAYTFNDFFIAKSQNMINNPIGIGVILSLLAVIGVIFILLKYRSSIVKKENAPYAIILFWLIYTFWGVNSKTFPIAATPGSFRTWMLLAIPVALVATEGFYFVKSFFTNKKIVQFFIAVILVAGLLYTSGIHKYEHNTAAWPTSGSFSIPQGPSEYGKWFNTLPKNTKVFLYSPRDKLTIGYGAYSCLWCQKVFDFRKVILEKTPQELHSFLVQQGYEYLILNGVMDYKYYKDDLGENSEQKLMEKYAEIQNSGLFTPVYQKENIFIVFEV